jgi:hypothetical protein
MPILQQASIDDRKRLLELFPVADLRHAFQAKGAKATKEEICYAAAADNSQQQIDRIAKFVDDHFGCCKQHVYVFSQGEEALALPADVPDGERVLNSANHGLYISRAIYTVILREPPEETTLEFLWPIRIEIHGQYMVVRFVVLERNATSYFERPSYVAGKSLTEKTILAGIRPNPADLNRGIKKLWEDGLIESNRGNFKKPLSLASEIMDEERDIKTHNPELYAIMQESPLYTTLFRVTDQFKIAGKENSVGSFSTDPSHGIIGFGSYSEKGDADGIIEKIISNN